jgi:serine kinase
MMAKADINPRIVEQRMLLKNEDTEHLGKRGFVLGRTIGEGSYAKVKVATSERHGMEGSVAVKIISVKNAPRNFKRKFLPRELRILRVLDHPHIIKLLNVYCTENKVSL